VSDPEESLGPARPDAGTRLRRAGAALVAQVRALLLPDRGVPPLVSMGRARFATVLVVAAALLAAAAVSARIDMAPAVRAESARGPGPGPGGGPPPPRAGAQPPGDDRTDRDIDEEIEKRTAIVKVKTWLAAGLGTPAWIVALALALFLLGRYVGGKPSFQRALAAAAVGALPWAVRSLVEAAVVWRQDRLLAGDLGQVVAGRLAIAGDHPILARLAASADLFSLWSLVLCGFGLSAAAGISRTRSFIAVTVGYLLFLLLLTSRGAP
jgi:hypothetical protein